MSASTVVATSPRPWLRSLGLALAAVLLVGGAVAARGHGRRCHAHRGHHAHHRTMGHHGDHAPRGGTPSVAGPGATEEDCVAALRAREASRQREREAAASCEGLCPAPEELLDEAGARARTHELDRAIAACLDPGPAHR